MRRSRATLLGVAALAGIAAVLLPAARAAAMPPFAQAYGAKCTLCHTEVPALNAYGRYVQRTGYAALDATVLKRSLPVWIGVNPSYDSANAAPQLQFGNVAVHAVGNVANTWTYHVQQWLWQNNQPGGLDTAWFAYNNLLRGSGHLFIGKIELPAPSPFSQWFDLANFALSQVTVGEHQYQLANNRWGSRFSYVRGSFDGEVGWVAGNGDLPAAADYTGSSDRTLQWKAAWAFPERPLEVGAFGSRGSFPLSEGGTDQYDSTAVYAQRDPRFGVPGALLIYQDTTDGNPGAGAARSSGNDATAEIFEPVLNGGGVITLRKEFTNDGLGNVTQSGNADFEYHPARFVHLYVETYLTQRSKPGYRYMLWWTTPLERIK